MVSDKEPVRYYDWMVWKMRQEDQKLQDVINSPAHYGQGEIECIDYLKDNLGLEGFSFVCEGNVKKYMHRFRFKHKNGLEDLGKAHKYLGWLIQTMEEINEKENSSAQCELDL